MGAKTPFNIYDVTPGAAGWELRHNGERKEFSTKEKAVVAARSEAKAHLPASLRIHDRRGRFQHEYSYGRDPRASKG